MIIKELNIEITKPKKWTKPYNEIKIPKEKRLIKVWELLWIYESKYKKIVFGEKGWLDFACEQLDIDKKNNWSRWFYRDWDDRLSARYGSLLDASGDGRVIFVKKLK